MLHDNMDLSRLMVHVQQVEDSRKRRAFVILRGLILLIKQVLPMEETGTTSVFVNSPSLKRGNNVLETLTRRGLQHLEEADQSP